MYYSRIVYFTLLVFLPVSIYGQINYQKAVHLYQAQKLDSTILTCQQILTQNPDEDTQIKVHTLTGIAYFYQIEYHNALEAFQTALGIAQRIENDEYLIKIHNYIGNAYLKLGEYTLAEKNYIRALFYNPNDALRGQVLNSLGETYRSQNKMDSALLHLQEALPLLSQGKKHYALNNIGLIYQQKAQYDSADAYLNQALEVRKALLSPEHRLIARTLNHLGRNNMLQEKYFVAMFYYLMVQDTQNDPIEVLISYMRRGDAYLRMGYLTTALDNYLIADSLINPVRQGLSNRNDKRYFSSKTAGFYENLIYLCFRMNRWEQAFYFSEKNKSRTLLEITQKTNSRGYNSPISVSNIQARLQPEQAVLSYAFYRNQLAIFVITTDTLAVFEVEKERITPDYQRFANRAASPASLEDYTKTAYQLYQSLFQPLEPCLINRKKLLIILDKDLYMPFDALIRKPASHQDSRPIYWDFSKYDFLLRYYQIDYHFSATLAFARQESRDYKLDYVGFAPNPSGYKQLPFSISEVIEARNLFLAQKQVALAYIGNNAKRNLLRNLNPRILHIATHHRNEGLIMSDSLLSLKELHDKEYNIHVDLAILSGCQTFKGKVLRGEGAINLVSNFLEAGANNVAFSFFSLYDEYAKENISRFFEEHLKKGKSYSDALYTAKLSFIQNPKTAHAFRWAGIGLLNSNFAQD